MMMDVDHVKLVNDTYGHPTGSHVLKECGHRIRHYLRYNDAAARYGGEEFIAYLPAADGATALACAERVRAGFEDRPFEHEHHRLAVTISIGISCFPEDGRDLDGLVREADLRLYRAKKNGRNRVTGPGAETAPPAS